jgi:hypothetical protein
LEPTLGAKSALNCGAIFNVALLHESALHATPASLMAIAFIWLSFLNTASLGFQ